MHMHMRHVALRAPPAGSFAFIEFSSDAEASAAIQKANGYKLDKSHTFIVNSLGDYYKYMAVTDVETEFVPPEYMPSENLRSWLMDENARDQFGASSPLGARRAR